MLAAHLSTVETGARLELSNLAIIYLGEDFSLSQLSASRRTLLFYHLTKKLKAELDRAEHRRIKKLFYAVEMPLRPVLRGMERQGVLVDRDLLERLSHDFSSQIQEVETGIFREVGHEFNLNSPKQLGEVLFDQLKLPEVKRTKTQRSTDESVLQKLLGSHPIVEELLRYRQLHKIKSTYLDPLPHMLDRKGRVHTTYHQTRTASGRLSSENPNLQNIPVDPELGLRRLFISPPGYQLLVADYSQIELGLMAHFSQDGRLVDAFGHGQDVHAATAARIFSKTINEVTKKERAVGKTINFALMYGMSEYGLAEQLNIDKSRAKLYIESYVGS